MCPGDRKTKPFFQERKLMRYAARTLPVAAILVATLGLGACSSGGGGGASPTAAEGPQATLATAYGTVTVLTNGNPFDAGRALQAIDAGYAKARTQVGSRIDSVRLDGMAISVKPGVFNGAVGQYHPNSDLVDVAQGVENVITHELQHRFCHRLGNSGSCCTLQDHSGGFNLACEAT
jgi:hypothetical protein